MRSIVEDWVMEGKEIGNSWCGGTIILSRWSGGLMEKMRSEPQRNAFPAEVLVVLMKVWEACWQVHGAGFIGPGSGEL